MIVKRSARNQVALPKQLIEQAGLGEGDLFFDVRYVGGCFVLTPLEFEEKVPPEALERFKTRALKPERGDRRASSMNEVLAALDRKKRR